MTTTLRNLKTAEAVAEQPTEQVAERKYPWVHALRELLADLVSDRVALVGAIGFLLFLAMAATAPVIVSAKSCSARSAAVTLSDRRRPPGQPEAMARARPATWRVRRAVSPERSATSNSASAPIRPSRG